MLYMVLVMVVLGVALTAAGLSLVCPAFKGKVIKTTAGLVALGGGFIVLHAVMPTVIDSFLSYTYYLLGIVG